MPDYDTDAGLLTHLQIQKQSIQQFKDEASADDADIETLNHDCDNTEFMIDLCPLADEFKTTAFGAKRTLIAGADGAEIGALMIAPSVTPPHPLIAGVRKRSRERDGRWKRSKTMTEAAMLALDLVDTPNKIVPETVKPTFEAFPALMGYHAAIVIAGRGESDMCKVLGQKNTGAKWTTLGSGTGKSVNVEIEATTPGQLERILVMVQLYKNNEPYGQPSDPQYVTFNP